MSEFRKALEEVAKENNITLDEDNFLGMPNDEYLDALEAWREEEREERNSLYNYSGPMDKELYNYLYKKNTNSSTEKPKEIIKKKVQSKPRKTREEREYERLQQELYNARYNLEHADEPGDINQCAEELSQTKDKIRHKALNNPKLLELIGENTLAEGDKKIFDKNSGYNVSEDELYIFDKLKEKYPNIQMSVTDDRMISPDTHRHWELDFYDPDSDTGFNYNKHIRHGRRKYNSEDPNCQADVKWLQRQEGDFYKKILHTWRDLDPLKREVAKVNGLKYIEWFNLDEFNKWFENPELSYEEYRYAPDSLQYDSEEYFDQKARGRDVYGNDSQPYAP